MNRSGWTSLATLLLWPTIVSCGLWLNEEESKFVQSGYQEQVDAILTAEPERKIDLYILAMTHVLPYNVGAKYALAERGSEILPFVLERLERERQDENILVLIELLVTMQILRHYCVGCDENALVIVRNATRRIQNGAVRADAQSIERNFLVAKVEQN